MKKLEQEIADQKKRDDELELLSQTEDPIQYLQSFESVLADPGCAVFPTLAHSPLTFEKVLKSVSQLKEKVETFLYDDLKKISTEDSLSAFAFASLSKLTFEDLAMKSGGFSFNEKVPNIFLPTARAAVFRTKTTPSYNEEEDKEGNRQNVNFKPVASLPKVKVKSGEEDEEILFKQRAKLFRWDRDICQWKERGVGDLKILFHPVKKLYRVLMRRDRVLKVCANHNITKDIELKPMNMSANALVWMATDYAEGDAKVEQLAAKFKTPELADSFKRSFTDCQRNTMLSSQCHTTTKDALTSHVPEEAHVL
ncbi:E3 SUMO-protein ligase RanBP2-like isoform 1-T1 [Clarias gariepinus]